MLLQLIREFNEPVIQVLEQGEQGFSEVDFVLKGYNKLVLGSAEVDQDPGEFSQHADISHVVKQADHVRNDIDTIHEKVMVQLAHLQAHCDPSHGQEILEDVLHVLLCIEVGQELE